MVVVRTITDDEVAAFTEAVSRGFHFAPSPERAEERAAFFRSRIEAGRSYGVFDGDAIVGTARSFATPLTVPGPAHLTAAAVSSVTVRATHRRMGALTEMMRQQLDEVATRGEAVAVLIASEAPIYGRFGYGAATENVRLEIDTGRLRFSAPPRGERVRFVDAGEFRSIAPGVYDCFRAAQVGAIRRDDAWWDEMTGIDPRPGGDPPGFLMVCTAPDGAPTGFAHYRVTATSESRVPTGSIVLQDLVAVSDAAYDALWRVVTSTDLVVHISAPDRPAREPLRALIADRRHVQEAERNDFLWVRLVDVATALASRRYDRADRIVLEVVDAFRPSSGGRFVLDAGPDGATCARTDGAPDLTLTQSDLGGCFHGAMPLSPAVAAGRVSEHRAGAAAACERLFADAPQRPPAWCNTWF
ncbi:MAG TPA: GNAT family N-acetyltransferase [Acidimicrobiales bacterium]|nr:GNAT family N-acetyltransferase [Acidimicrobiales bacterium]